MLTSRHKTGARPDGSEGRAVAPERIACCVGHWLDTMLESGVSDVPSALLYRFVFYLNSSSMSCQVRNRPSAVRLFVGCVRLWGRAQSPKLHMLARTELVESALLYVPAIRSPGRGRCILPASHRLIDNEYRP